MRPFTLVYGEPSAPETATFEARTRGEAQRWFDEIFDAPVHFIAETSDPQEAIRQYQADLFADQYLRG